MNRFHPSPALVISLIALFVAVGGTSYAAINALPKNSVGTKQLKNGAVTAGKLAYRQTLPSGKTETGDWGSGATSFGVDGDNDYAVFSFTVPLAGRIDGGHTIYVSEKSATHCSGAGHADAGYLCVYQANIFQADTPTSSSIINPETVGPSTYEDGTGKYGWGIIIHTPNEGGSFVVSGSYAVTAP